MRHGVLFSGLLLFSIGLNVFGSYIEGIYLFPLYLDSIGTIFSAMILGPHIGALVGLLTNVITGIWISEENFLFTVVNVLIGLTTGIMLHTKNINFKTIFLAAIVVSIISSIMGNMVSIYFFGGITEGGVGHITQTIIALGQGIPTAAFAAGLYTNFADKLLSFMAAFFIIYLFQDRLSIYDLKLGD
uniref:Energy-coupling factor transport system substrate-specific component n=1 Tax=Methanococcus maripaludis (strain C6 / ATCC BAA-1332) TaxID=444158 RepID=A9A8I6_METM6